MTAVMVLKDGKVETVLQTNDFEYLVDKYMGYDARKYFEDLIQELQEEADYNQAKIDTDLGAYEASLESNTTCFQDILDEMEEMKTIISAPRVNKQKMLNLIEQVQEQINNQI